MCHKKFSFPLFQLIGKMNSIPMKRTWLTKNINLFQFLYNLQVGFPELGLPGIYQSSWNHSKSNNDIEYRVKVFIKVLGRVHKNYDFPILKIKTFLYPQPYFL